MISTLSGKRLSQREYELNKYLELISGYGSYLEIGSREGDTLYEASKVLSKNSRITAIDLPDGAWGNSLSQKKLVDCIKQLNSDEHTANVIFGNSQDKTTISKITDKYDVVFIDGDHTYDGVKKDFENYSPFANKFVAFHDIDGEGMKCKKTSLKVKVPKFWNEIKEQYSVYYEYIDPDNRGMGIGVIDITTKK